MKDIKQIDIVWLKEEVVSYLLITVGTLIMTVGIYFFKFPNNFSTGGESSLAVLLAAVCPKFTRAEYMFGINIFLLILGLILFGKKFACKTIYCSILLSLLTWVLETCIPINAPITNQRLLELFFGVGLTAVGSAVIFNERASSGGTDIVAMILKRYTSLDIGKALLCSDFILALSSAVIFNVETGLFSILGLILKAFWVDNIIDNINLSKCFMIITDKPDEVCEFINKKLHRGATVSACKGAFTDDEKKFIITVLKRNQAVLLKAFIKQIDKHAFSVITNSSDILGKGFRTIL